MKIVTWSNLTSREVKYGVRRLHRVKRKRIEKEMVVKVDNLLPKRTSLVLGLVYGYKGGLERLRLLTVIQ